MAKADKLYAGKKKSGSGADLDENGYDNNPDSYEGITRTFTDENGNQMSHTIGKDEIEMFKKEKAAAKTKSDAKKKPKSDRMYKSADADSNKDSK